MKKPLRRTSATAASEKKSRVRGAKGKNEGEREKRSKSSRGRDSNPRAAVAGKSPPGQRGNVSRGSHDQVKGAVRTTWYSKI